MRAASVLVLVCAAALMRWCAASVLVCTAALIRCAAACVLVCAAAPMRCACCQCAGVYCSTDEVVCRYCAGAGVCCSTDEVCVSLLCWCVLLLMRCAAAVLEHCGFMRAADVYCNSDTALTCLAIIELFLLPSLKPCVK